MKTKSQIPWVDPHWLGRAPGALLAAVFLRSLGIYPLPGWSAVGGNKEPSIWSGEEEEKNSLLLALSAPSICVSGAAASGSQ